MDAKNDCTDRRAALKALELELEQELRSAEDYIATALLRLDHAQGRNLPDVVVQEKPIITESENESLRAQAAVSESLLLRTPVLAPLLARRLEEAGYDHVEFAEEPCSRVGEWLSCEDAGIITEGTDDDSFASCEDEPCAPVTVSIRAPVVAIKETAQTRAARLARLVSTYGKSARYEEEDCHSFASDDADEPPREACADTCDATSQQAACAALAVRAAKRDAQVATVVLQLQARARGASQRRFSLRRCLATIVFLQIV